MWFAFSSLLFCNYLSDAEQNLAVVRVCDVVWCPAMVCMSGMVCSLTVECLGEMAWTHLPENRMRQMVLGYADGFMPLSALLALTVSKMHFCFLLDGPMSSTNEDPLP